MVYFRNILFGFVLILFIVLVLLITPTSHALILSKVTSYCLQTTATFDLPKIGWNSYAIDGLLEQNNSIGIYADYNHFESADATVHFNGDIALFSKVADIELPHIAAVLNATIGPEKKLIADAALLDGSLSVWFDLNDLTYHAVAKDLSLQSYQKQQQMASYIDGEIALVSQGALLETMDLNLSLQSANMHLLEPALALMALKQESPVPAEINIALDLNDTKLHADLGIDSALAHLTVHSLYYELEKGDFEAGVDVINRIEAYEPFRNLQVKAKGRYADDKLKSNLFLNADGYILELGGVTYEEERLYTKYVLYSDHQEFADITPAHQITGVVTYTPDGAEATITSPLLRDVVSIDYDNTALHLKADRLSLGGLLQHLKFEPFASANLALRADANLSEALQWQATLDTSDLLLSKEMTEALGNDGAIALQVKAFNTDDDRIMVHPKIFSTMMRLDQSDIIYDLNRSVLTMTGELTDINLSYYRTPELSLRSSVNLDDVLRVRADIKSPYEDVSLSLSKQKDKLEGDLLFDFHNLKHIASLEGINHLCGTVDFTSANNKHHINAHLKDLNSTFYNAAFININGSLKQADLLHGAFKIKTPYEKIRLNFDHDASMSDANFFYDVARLDRFAPLNPNYTTNGSGHLVYRRDKLTLDVDSEQFGLISLSQKEGKTTVDMEAVPANELFLLTDQKAVIDGNLSLHAQMTPSNTKAKLHSPLIQPTDQNASIRSTSLNVKLDLDGNSTRYDGTMEITTDHETLKFTNLKLSPALTTLKSDFTLKSDDLQQGTPILPDVLVGSTRFDGNVIYDHSLTLHLSNQAIGLSEQLHQKLDENSSGGFSMKLAADLLYDSEKADLDVVASSPYFKLDTFKTHIDLKHTLLTSLLHLNTDLWQKESDARIKMHYVNPIHIDAHIKTAYEILSMNDMVIDTDTQYVDGTYHLLLKQTSPNAFMTHGDAEFDGKLSNHPKPMATLKSESFGGNIKIVATQQEKRQEITIDAEELLLEKVMKFLAVDSSLKSGDLDLHGVVYSDDFLEFDTSTMKAELSLDASDLLLVGIDADKSIDLLKNYQDISIFEGNFPGKGIVTSIVKAPVDLVGREKRVSSTIRQVHADSYVEDGRFYCYDCAVKTEKNRIAVKGAIDLNTTDFQHFEIGLLQKNGCAFFTQEIKGNISEPEIRLSKTSLALITGTVKSVGRVMKSGVDLGTSLISGTGELTGDVIDAITGDIPIAGRVTGTASSAVRTITDSPESANEMLTSKCIPFYRGVVRHPD